jgi:flagellar basal-body rod protein FlgF
MSWLTSRRLALKKLIKWLIVLFESKGDGFDTRFLPRAMTSPQSIYRRVSRQFTGRPWMLRWIISQYWRFSLKNGELAWTRRGDLSLDPEGFVRTGEGYLVLDESLAPLQLPQGQ